MESRLRGVLMLLMLSSSECGNGVFSIRGAGNRCERGHARELGVVWRMLVDGQKQRGDDGQTRRRMNWKAAES